MKHAGNLCRLVERDKLDKLSRYADEGRCQGNLNSR